MGSTTPRIRDRHIEGCFVLVVDTRSNKCTLALFFLSCRRLIESATDDNPLSP